MAAALISLLNPVKLIMFLWTLLRIIVFAVAVPALFAGVPWLATRGSEGVAAAARIGVESHSARVSAFALSWLIVRRLLRGPVGAEEPSDRSAAFARRRSEPALTAATVGTSLLLLVFGLAVHGNRWAPLSSGEAVLDFLPNLISRPLGAGQRSVAVAEGDAVIECVNNALGYMWAGAGVEEDASTSDRLVITAYTDASLTPVAIGRSASVLAVALQNQLAPWVHTVEVHPPGKGRVITIDRTRLRMDVLLTRIEPDAVTPTGALPAAPGAESTIFQCSARAL